MRKILFRGNDKNDVCEFNGNMHDNPKFLSGDTK